VAHIKRASSEIEFMKYDMRIWFLPTAANKVNSLRPLLRTASTLFVVLLASTLCGAYEIETHVAITERAINSAGAGNYSSFLVSLINSQPRKDAALLSIVAAEEKAVDLEGALDSLTLSVTYPLRTMHTG
jgi:hypothetical protein